MGWQHTLIQLDVAATKKLCWLCRLSTGSLNILNTLFCLFYFLKCVSSPYYGISPFGVFFYKADLKIQFCNLVRRNGTKNGTNLPIIPSKNESPRHSTDRVYLYKKCGSSMRFHTCQCIEFFRGISNYVTCLPSG